VLGVIFSLLSAATFALNIVAARRGVVTGTPVQGMIITIPVGVLCFLPITIATGELWHIAAFPLAAAAWMVLLGVVHFIIGRYCNFKANQVAGVNLTAPVVQLQVVVQLASAVAILNEPCTALQIIGGVLILAGSLITQRQMPGTRRVPASANGAAAQPEPPAFKPRYLAGYIFASLAALSYGVTPVMARFALADTGPSTGILGGLIAYAAATLVVGAMLLLRPVRGDLAKLKRENIRWFVYSGVFVAMAQGFFFAAIAVAPIMLVTPILQLSLVFRFLFSTWFNADHEAFGALVIAGVVTSVLGSLTVAVDTDLILNTLAIPDGIAALLRWRV
jgi:drug/metabolite transporter (DMT)-like permease